MVNAIVLGHCCAELVGLQKMHNHLYSCARERRAISSVGRAPRLHRDGRKFESCIAHSNIVETKRKQNPIWTSQSPCYTPRMAEPFSGDDKAVKILCFGDSITFGAWDTQGGWVDRLKRTVFQKSITSELRYWGTVSNEGISGDTSEDVLKRLSRELESNTWPGEELTILIAVGTNDSAERMKTGEPWIPLDDYRKNMHAIAEVARSHAQKIACLGTTPVDDTKTIPTLWDPEWRYMDARSKEYERALQDVCEAERVPFLSLREALADHDLDAILYDGLHPNDLGHQLIYEHVYHWLEGREWV